MTDLPNPLTSSDCDLRNFQFMPLDVLRLRDSDTAAIASGEEFRCAVLLWCASWHQVPAASLPDNDMSLASLAGMGRAVKDWIKLRDGALRGWIKCSDGRFYHPVISEKAMEAFIGKEEFQEASGNKKSRQERWRARCKELYQCLRELGISVPPGASLSTLESILASTLASTNVDSKASHVDATVDNYVDGDLSTRDKSETGLRGTGTGTGTGTGILKTFTTPAGVVVGNDAPDLFGGQPGKPEDPPQTRKVPDCPHQKIIDLFHEVFSMATRVRVWNETRQTHLRTRWAEKPARQNLDWWQKFFEFILTSDFLTSKTPTQPGKRPFVLSLDWLVKAENMAKVIEGKYHV